MGTSDHLLSPLTPPVPSGHPWSHGNDLNNKGPIKNPCFSIYFPIHFPFHLLTKNVPKCKSGIDELVLLGTALGMDAPFLQGSLILCKVLTIRALYIHLGLHCSFFFQV